MHLPCTFFLFFILYCSFINNCFILYCSLEITTEVSREINMFLMDLDQFHTVLILKYPFYFKGITLHSKLLQSSKNTRRFFVVVYPFYYYFFGLSCLSQNFPPHFFLSLIFFFFLFSFAIQISLMFKSTVLGFLTISLCQLSFSSCAEPAFKSHTSSLSRWLLTCTAIKSQLFRQSVNARGEKPPCGSFNDLNWIDTSGWGRLVHYTAD